MRLPWLVVVGVVLMGLVGVTPAASRLGVNAATRVTADPAGEFFAVSCARPSFCLAVGTAAASWDGHHWHLLSTPTTASGSVNVFMNGVSCPAVDDCVVVGDFDTSTTTLTLAEHWNGSRWTALGVGTDPHAVLKTVACPTTSWCMAAGSTGPTSTRTLAGIWNGPSGGGWRVTASPNVAGSSSNVFRQLSCAGPTVCVGLASAVDSWNGDTWTSVPTGPYAVNDVSCLPGAGSTGCTYLGLYGSGTSVYSDTLRDDGAAGWQAVGNIHGAKLSGNPAAYACAPADSCHVVGQQTIHATGDVITYAEHWNGNRWAAVQSASPNPPHTGLEYDAFFGVACVRADNCAAVGRANDDVLAEHWNGRRWILDTFAGTPASKKTQQPPKPPTPTTPTPKPKAPQASAKLPDTCNFATNDIVVDLLGEHIAGNPLPGTEWMNRNTATASALCWWVVPGADVAWIYAGYVPPAAAYDFMTPAFSIGSFTTSTIRGFPGATLFASTSPWVIRYEKQGNSDWAAIVNFKRVIDGTTIYGSVFSSFDFPDVCTTQAAAVNVEMVAVDLYRTFGGTPPSISLPTAPPCKF